MSEKQSPSALGFLAGKIKHLSLATLVFLQAEEFLWWLVSSLPGMPGILLRNGVARITFKSKLGFSWIGHRVTIVHGDRLKVGKNLGINTGTYINAVGGIEMGDFVLLGNNVTISSGRHPIEGKFPPIYTRVSEPKKIKIGDDVWIAAGAVIMPGITLADGTVVGANSVVTRDTTPYSVVGGIPAKILKMRDDLSAIEQASLRP